MQKFKKYYLTEKVEDPNYGLENDAKGKLHELLVGHFLMHGTEHDHPDHTPTSLLPKFPQRPTNTEGKKEKKSRAVADTPEGLHDHIKKSISQTNYMHHVRIAKFAANKIKEGLQEAGHLSKDSKSNSGRITNVHWTSRPADIARLHGSSDPANTSDIVVEKKKRKKSLVVETDYGPKNGGEHIGISLKIHNEPKQSSLANLGRGSLDKLFHVNTDQIEKKAINAAHDAAAVYGIDTKSMSKKQAHATIKRNINVKETYKDQARKGLTSITDKYKTALENINSHHLANKLRLIANVKPTKMKMYKSATYGTTNLSHSFHNPAVEFESILKQHAGHIKIGKSSDSVIKFTGKQNIPLGTLAIKYNSSTPHTGVVGVLQGWSSSAKHSVTPETHELVAKKLGYA